MTESETRVATPAASRYLQALCKHFRHKITVEFDAAAGRCEFPFGTCHMTAGEGELAIRCAARDAEALAQMQSIVQTHLERFAWRESPAIHWTPIGPA